MLSRLLLLLFALISVSQAAEYVENGNITLTSKSAYCYYYLTSNAHITDVDTYMAATSNNLYAYASVYVSANLQLDDSSVALGKCRPNDFSNKSCNTSTDDTFTYISYDTQYVLACVECHYWLGDCIIDDYVAGLTSPPQQGVVPCLFCK